jgi:hypothetical protein
MGLLAILGGLVMAIALVVREVQLSRERANHTAELERVRQSQGELRRQLRRALEDLYVLQNVLGDKHLLDEHDLARGRARHIDGPRRIAEERDSILSKHDDVEATQLVIDEDINKVH